MRTEVYINDLLIDSEGIAIPLNFMVADIQEPESKKGNFSKTVTLPGTQRNNDVYTEIYEIDKIIQGTGQLAPDYNPNLNASGRIYQDGIEIFRGTTQLLKVTDQRGRISYEANFFGPSVDLFSKLSDSLVSDLDISEYDHTFTFANTSGSWQDFIIKNGSPEPFNLGEGYVYPVIDWGLNLSFNKFKGDQFSPAIYLRTIFDKIFTGAGFTWTSAFLDSSIFKSLIIPSAPQQMTLNASDIEPRLFQAQSTSDLYVNATGYYSIDFPNDSTGGNFNNGGNFSTPQYTVPANGYYTLQSDLLVEINTFGSHIPFLFYGYFQILQSGNVIASQKLQYDFSTGPLSTTVQGSLSINATNIRAIAGDTFEIRFYVPSSLVFPGGWSNNFAIKSGSYFFNAVEINKIGLNDTILINKALPTKIKQAELLSDIFRMFNLYVLPDPDNETNLIIEPYDDFYLNTITNWDTRVDHSREIEITPMAELQANSYKFTHKEDKDYRNQIYLASNNELYGERTIEVENDFVTDEKEIKSLFSPTPLTGIAGSTFVIPQIVGVDKGNIKELKDPNIRLLYYGGLKPGKWQIDAGIITHTLNNYPYAGHLDDPFSPSFDLCFAPPRQLYYAGQITYTDNNIYNKYWRRYITEITDKDSKLVTAWLRLKPIDIYKLNIRNLFYWDNHYFRLQKIIDYDASAERLTKCEFLKIKEASVFTPQTKKIINGGNDSLGDGPDTLPNNDPKIRKGENSERNDNALNGNEIIGEGNIVGDSVRVKIMGNDNVIGDDCECINIMCGSGNVIEGGVTNVTLINTSGQTIEDSNVVYINGSLYE